MKQKRNVLAKLIGTWLITTSACSQEISRPGDGPFLVVTHQNKVLYPIINKDIGNRFDLVMYDMATSQVQTHYALPATRDEGCTLSWCIRNEILWVVDGEILINEPTYQILRFPLSRLTEAFSEEARRKAPITKKPGMQGLVEDIRDGLAEEQKAGQFFGPCRPIDRAYYARNYEENTDGPIHFGFVPTSETSLRVFTLSRKMLRSWSYSSKWLGDDWDYSEDWKQEQAIAAPFYEPFQAYAQGDTYLLVTASGNVYSWRLGSKEVPAKIWDTDKAPVKTIIQDADNDKVYAFARGQYFELAEKLEPKEYSRSLAQLIGMAPSKNQLIDMARIIRADQAAAKKK